MVSRRTAGCSTPACPARKNIRAAKVDLIFYRLFAFRNKNNFSLIQLLFLRRRSRVSFVGEPRASRSRRLFEERTRPKRLGPARDERSRISFEVTQGYSNCRDREIQ